MIYIRYKPPITRGVGGFFTNTPDDEAKEAKVKDPLVDAINAKVLEYYNEHKEKPNALVLGARIYQDIDKSYLKWLHSRGIVVVVVPLDGDIVWGKVM